MFTRGVEFSRVITIWLIEVTELRFTGIGFMWIT